MLSLDADVAKQNSKGVKFSGSVKWRMTAFNGTPCSFVVNDAKKRRKFSSSPPMTCFCLAEFLEKEWEGQVQVLRGTNEENYKMRIFVAMVKRLGYLLYNRSYPFFFVFLGGRWFPTLIYQYVPINMHFTHGCPSWFVNLSFLFVAKKVFHDFDVV